MRVNEEEVRTLFVFVFECIPDEDKWDAEDDEVTGSIAGLLADVITPTARHAQNIRSWIYVRETYTYMSPHFPHE